MAEISAPRSYGPIDLNALCKNWETDADGTEHGMQCNHRALVALAAGINHLYAMNFRVSYNYAYPRAGTGGSTVEANSPLFAGLVPDYVDNARHRIVTTLAYPPETDAGDQYMQRTEWNGTDWNVDTDSIGSTYRKAIAEGFEWPDHWFVDRLEYKRGAVTDSEVQEGVATFNGYGVVDCVVQEMPTVSLDSDIHTAVDGFYIGPGDNIMENVIEELRNKFEDLRQMQTPTVFSWSASGAAAGGSNGFTIAGIDDPGAGSMARTAHGVWVSNTTPTNIIDGSSTTRTATTPGISVHARYCGVGPITKDAGKTIKVQCRVFAECTHNNGYVYFNGSDSFSGNITSVVITNAGLDWYGTTSNTIKLDASIADDDATESRNKIDLMSYVDSNSSDLKVYAAYGFIDQTSI